MGSLLCGNLESNNAVDSDSDSDSDETWVLVAAANSTIIFRFGC